MPTQDELDWENTVSRNQQEEGRSRRSALKGVRSDKGEALNRATSTKQRREIKGYYEEKKGKIIDVSVNPPQSQNQDDANSDISQDGIDTSVERQGGGGGGLPSGYVETDVILCVNGSPVSGQLLFKRDEE